MAQDLPLHLRPVVYTLPNMDHVVVQPDVTIPAQDGTPLLLDAYRPQQNPNAPLPGVIFIHGGPVSPERNMKETGQYRSWGALAAASGLVGFAFNHRYHAPNLLEQSAQDVRSTIDYIRAHAPIFGLDPQRLCIWTCSGGGPHLSIVLRDQPEYFRCIVAYYAILDTQPIDYLVEALDEQALRQYSASSYVQSNPLRFPILIARAGLDHPVLNQTIDTFIGHALHQNCNLEVLNHPQGHHGFDVTDDDQRSRHIIARTLAFILENI